MGNDQLTPALLERPLTKPEDFFDFDTKYLVGGKKGKGAKGAEGYSQLPADLPKALYDKTEAIGLEAYRSIGCSGTARVDLLIDSKTEQVYFNEINPLPGDLYAHNWNRAGVSNVELVQKLIELAKERYQQRSLLTRVFNTNYLQQF
jgi:D-alanine-D-alanine ligase